MTRAIALISALMLMAFVSLSAQTNDATKWLSVVSEDDVQDTVVFRAMSNFDGKHYELKIYGRDLKGVPKWKDGGELPISMSDVRARVNGAFQKQFPRFNDFKLTSLNLLHLTLIDDWYILAEFRGDGPSKLAEPKNINLLVLLNGRTITPTETAQ